MIRRPPPGPHGRVSRASRRLGLDVWTFWLTKMIAFGVRLFGNAVIFPSQLERYECDQRDTKVLMIALASNSNNLR